MIGERHTGERAGERTVFGTYLIETMRNEERRDSETFAGPARRRGGAFRVFSSVVNRQYLLTAITTTREMREIGAINKI